MKHKMWSKKIVFVSGVISLMIALFISHFNDLGFENPSIYSAFDFMPLFWYFGYVIVVAPIVEEVIFRFPLLKSKKVSIIFTFIQGVLAIALIQTIWILFIVILLISIKILLENKYRFIHLETSIVLSSILFGLCHLSSDNLSVKFHIFYFTYTFGVGIILSFIRVRFNIWMAMFMHMAINLSVPIGDYFVFPSEVSINSPEITLNLKRIGIFGGQSIEPTVSYNDTLYFNQMSLSSILQELTMKNSSTFYKFRKMQVKYSGFVYMTPSGLEDVLNAFNLDKKVTSEIKTQYRVFSSVSDTFHQNMAINSLQMALDSYSSENPLMLEKNSLKKVFDNISKRYATPIYLDLTEQQKSQVFELYYPSNASFAEVFQAINEQLNFMLLYDKQEVKVNIILVR